MREFDAGRVTPRQCSLCYRHFLHGKQVDPDSHRLSRIDGNVCHSQASFFRASSTFRSTVMAKGDAVKIEVMRAAELGVRKLVSANGPDLD